MSHHDLSTLSTPTLEAMSARLTNWIVGIAALDVLMLAGAAYLLMTGPVARVIPLVPILMLPALALVPFLRRVAALRREIGKRRAG